MVALDILHLRGEILVVTGPMGTAKTDKLIRHAEALTHQTRFNCLAFNHRGNRFDVPFLVARGNCGNTNKQYPAIQVSSSDELYDKVREEEFRTKRRVDLVLIDEGQFFDRDLPKVATRLAEGGRVVEVATLNEDFRTEGFASAPYLIRIAKSQNVKVKTPYCKAIREDGEQCPNVAAHSQRVHLIRDPTKEQEARFYDHTMEAVSGFAPDPYFDPTEITEGHGDRQYFAVCDSCHKVPYAKLTRDVEEFIREHPGIEQRILDVMVEEAMHDLSGIEHLKDITRFLLDPTEHRTEVINGRIRSYN